MPATIAIEPTNLCNLACKECPAGTQSLKRAKGDIDVGLFEKTITQIHKSLISCILYFQGEPFLNKQLFKMIQLAHTKKLYTYCSTNGHFLNNENAKRTIESGIDELIISLDGTTQKVYESYRQKGSLKTVLEGTKNIIKWKNKLNRNKPFVKFQFLVIKPNENQINDAKLLAKEIKVDAISFKSAQIYDYKNGNGLIPENEKYSRYKKQADGGYRIKSKLKNRCWRMWSNPVVTIDGSVIPCCFDKDTKYKMGNLNTQSFQEIWDGEKYRAFRQQILTNRKEIDICRNCTEGLRLD
jgi:radical SAM protein with 4Fe4S-binding SPASM domain